MPDSSYYKLHQLAELNDGYATVTPAYERLLGEYLSLRLTNEAAYEYVRHGFVRRLGTLKRSIENVYSIYPPERSDKPTRDECLDLAINLQSFMFNVFGCIDNLATTQNRSIFGVSRHLGPKCLERRFSRRSGFCSHSRGGRAQESKNPLRSAGAAAPASCAKSGRIICAIKRRCTALFPAIRSSWRFSDKLAGKP
jgi:hypothetical protein